ncbi:hypothetical protein C8Q80DRAFT_174014 [Daedaleopsis nitida]|nr:hypothetical protein C8Q80DRAFT_174014 [Daedaleopsis nitida]
MVCDPTTHSLLAPLVMSPSQTVLVGSTSTFPTEIYEHVIDDLLCVPMHWRDVVRTLLSCARVCRAWTPRSRLHLYTAIQFYQGGHGIDNSARKLARTLVAQPHLARLVSAVSIVAPGMVLVPVAAALQNVPVLLAGKLPNLTTLHFRGSPPPTPQGIAFLSTPPEVLHRSFFASVATFPRLSSLELYCASFKSLKQLLQMLAGLRALRTLSMIGIDVIKWHADPVHTLTRLPEVTNLAVGEPKDRCVPRTSQSCRGQ